MVNVMLDVWLGFVCLATSGALIIIIYLDFKLCKHKNKNITRLKALEIKLNEASSELLEDLKEGVIWHIRTRISSERPIESVKGVTRPGRRR